MKIMKLATRKGHIDYNGDSVTGIHAKEAFTTMLSRSFRHHVIARTLISKKATILSKLVNCT